MSQKEGQFQCPECQAQIDIPKGSRFDQLPTSLYHKTLLNLLAVQQNGGGNEISCGLCKKQSAEISYCFDCDKLMCSACLNAHELFKAVAFKGHKVTPVKQFQAEDYEALLKRKSFCAQKDHEKEVIRFYCRDCEACVCQICINTDHKNHEIESLEKAADEERAKILAGMEVMKKKNEVCSDAVCQFEEKAANLESDITTAKRQVSQAAEQMIAAVREREREAIAVLENTRASRKGKLETAKKQVERIAKQLNQAAEYASDAAQRSSSADTVLPFQELSLTELPTVPVSAFVKFVPSSEPNDLSLGFIKTSETDANDAATEEGSGQTFQSGVEAENTTSPKTENTRKTNPEQSTRKK